MRLKSFLDVISTDAAYTNLNCCYVESTQDMFTGEDLRYSYLNGDMKISADANKIVEINMLRDRIFRSLENNPDDVLLIDEVRGKIYTSITEKNDPFFYRLAKNIEDFTVKTTDFSNADHLKIRISKMVPYSIARNASVDNGYRQCVLV